MKLNFEECDIIAAALQEYAEKHPERRGETDALADRIVEHQSSESEA